MNWLRELFNSPQADEKDEYQRRIGRFANDRAMGGDEGRQQGFQQGVTDGRNPPRRTRSMDSQDGWIYPETQEGDAGRIRLRESSGMNGLPTQGGGRMLLEVKDGSRWRRVTDQREALSILNNVKRRSDDDEPQDIDGDGLLDYRDQGSY